MKKLLLFTFLLNVFSLLHAQYCTTGGPTSTIDSNVGLVQLNGNSTNINYVGCPGVIGVEDQTVQVADISAGSSYSLVVTFSTCGGNFLGAGTAWIDWNGNSGFDASEVVGTWTGMPPNVSTFNFTVPSGACNGLRYLRVMQQEAGVLPLNPCGTFTYGSVTDFTVDISLGDCSLFSSTYCGGGPTTNTDSNISSVQFLGNTSNINFTGTCPGFLGVEDQTILSADVTAGLSYSLNVQFGTCGGSYAGVGEIWIDYNQSNSFEPTESVGTWTGTPPTGVSAYTVSIPASAVNGITRMRAMQYEGGFLPLDPCASFNWGSVVDFTIDVTGGIDCSGFLGDKLSEAIVVPSIPYIDTNSTTICYQSFSTVYPSPDVYYEFVTNPGSTTVKISLCSSSFDTYLSLLDSNGTLIAYNDDGICGSNAQLIYNSSNSDTLYAVVEGWNTAQGDFILTIDDVTGIEEYNKELNVITVNPNPATDVIVIGSTVTMKTIEFLEVSGKIISTIHVRGLRTNEWKVSDLQNGIYFVKVIDINGNIVIQKLIKQ